MYTNKKVEPRRRFHDLRNYNLQHFTNKNTNFHQNKKLKQNTKEASKQLECKMWNVKFSKLILLVTRKKRAYKSCIQNSWKKENKLCFRTPNAIYGFSSNDKSHFVLVSLSRRHTNQYLPFLSGITRYLSPFNTPTIHNLSLSFQSVGRPCAQVITLRMGTPILTNTSIQPQKRKYL